MNDKTKELAIILLRTYVINKIDQILENLNEVALITLSISSKVSPLKIEEFIVRRGENIRFAEYIDRIRAI